MTIEEEFKEFCGKNVSYMADRIEITDGKDYEEFMKFMGLIDRGLKASDIYEGTYQATYHGKKLSAIDLLCSVYVGPGENSIQSEVNERLPLYIEKLIENEKKSETTSSEKDNKKIIKISPETLCRIAEKGHSSTVEYLINMPSVDLSAKIDENPQLWLPLVSNALSAAKIDNARIILKNAREKIGEKFNINLIGKLGISVCSYSIRYASDFPKKSQDFLSFLKELIDDYGADPMPHKDKPEMLAIHFSGYCDVEFAEYLIEISGDEIVNFIDENGCTSLHHASAVGNKSTILYLISKGADLNIKDNEGSIPLHFAIRGGDLEVINLLGEAGSDLTTKDKDGDTPLAIAESQLKEEEQEGNRENVNKYKEIIKWLGGVNLETVAKSTHDLSEKVNDLEKENEGLVKTIERLEAKVDKVLELLQTFLKEERKTSKMEEDITIASSSLFKKRK